MTCHCLKKINQISELDIEPIYSSRGLRYHGGTFIHIIGCFLKGGSASPAHPGIPPSVRGIPAGGWVSATGMWLCLENAGIGGEGIIYSFCLAWYRAFKYSLCPGDTSFHVQFWTVLTCLFSRPFPSSLLLFLPPCSLSWPQTPYLLCATSHRLL